MGRHIHEICVGEKLSLTEKMEDKDLLLYLGLTNDTNPLYIQHDYVMQTPYKKPIVPTTMLTGIISSSINKYLPGPGSHIMKLELNFLQAIHHGELLKFDFEVVHVDVERQIVTVQTVVCTEDDVLVIDGNIVVTPPYMTPSVHHALDNF
nr:MaoC family dehydratase N-terminal domain-containing protein [Priestia taiwanensis]